jgi:hypothetical protein
VRENRQPLGEVEGHIPALRRYARGLIGQDRPDQVACADEMVREVIERSRCNGPLSVFKNPRLWLYATLTSCNRARARTTPPGATPTGPAGAKGVRETLAQVALEDREALLDLARTFDERRPTETPEPTSSIPAPAGEITPGDDYDAKADIPALLKAHGWRPCGPSGKYWTRPGKARNPAFPQRRWRRQKAK